MSDETGPNRTTENKRFIPKVMFLCAVAEPRMDPKTGKRFDGKIGCWPLVTQSPAKRNSKNRAKGTLITEPVSVTRSVYRDCLIDHVIPAIKARWPRNESKSIKIQQDNASSHVLLDDAKVLAACTDSGWDIRMVNQPAKSPDLNVLDLGFFNAIQSLQYQRPSKNIDTLIGSVNEAFLELSDEKLENNFQTLRAVMRAILENEGSNDFKIPHSGKDRARREGFFGDRQTVSVPTVEAVMDSLEDMYARREDEASVNALCNLFNELGVPDELEIHEL